MPASQCQWKIADTGSSAGGGGALPSAWETWDEFQVPDFRLAQPSVLQAFDPAQQSHGPGAQRMSGSLRECKVHMQRGKDSWLGPSLKQVLPWEEVSMKISMGQWLQWGLGFMSQDISTHDLTMP